MGIYAHNIHRTFTAGLRLAVCLVLLVLGAFSLRAQEITSTRVKILFPFDSDVVLENYRGNADAISMLDDVFADKTAEDELTITSYSSPEGNLAYNRDLSLRRAKSLQAYLENKYPQLLGKITLCPGEEAWEDLRIQIESDSRISEATRSSVLAIIGKDIEPDAKEKELGALAEYKRLYANYFKSLRFAAIDLGTNNSQIPENADKNTGKIADNSSSYTVKTVTDGLPTVYYATSEDFIRPSYMGNSDSMKEIIRILKSGKVRNMVIEGTASPEGPAKGNERLAKERAENLKNYIVGMFPELEDKITVASKGVIEGAEEDYPYLRYARIASIETVDTAEDTDTAVVKETGETAEPVNVPVNVPVETKKDVDTVDTVENVETVEVIDTTETPAYIRKPLAALTTNLLYTGGGAIATGFHAVPIAVGYEIPIGKHWSIHSNYLVTVPWKPWNNNAECAELMHWDIGARWYPGTKFLKPFKAKGDTRVLEGWYASASAGMGYYDFQHNGNGYQGEEVLASLGLGYSLAFNDNWSLNFGIGVGPMYTRYRYYEGRQNNQHLVYRYNGKFTYFGVTDAKVTLTYLFYYKKRITK